MAPSRIGFASGDERVSLRGPPKVIVLVVSPFKPPTKGTPHKVTHEGSQDGPVGPWIRMDAEDLTELLPGDSKRRRPQLLRAGHFKG